MVLQFVIIWAVAIFGFQILLKILEKPVPETAFIEYKANREALLTGNPDRAALQSIGRSALTVLSKVSIGPEYREALDNCVSWLAYELADESLRESFVTAVTDFETIASSAELNDPAYLSAKAEVSAYARDLFGFADNDVRAKIAPLEIKSGLMNSFGEKEKAVTDSAMNLYLIHNRSVLTDTNFLGFPFHYFYTAVFLLILFVGLCWLYCIRTDMFNKKYGIED